MPRIKDQREAYSQKAARIHNEELIPAYRQYEQSISQLNDVLTTSQIGVLESRILERYRTEEAVAFLWMHWKP